MQLFENHEKKKLKEKAIKSFNKNNGIISSESDDVNDLNGIEMKERDELNDSSTNLANLNPIEISMPSTNSK